MDRAVLAVSTDDFIELARRVRDASDEQFAAALLMKLYFDGKVEGVKELAKITTLTREATHGN